MTHADLPLDEPLEDGSELSNWAKGCAPTSPLRQSELSAGKTLARDQRSFIFDHVSAMDICQHPEIRRLHGYASTPGTAPTILEPLFTFAKTTVHNDVLATPYEQYSSTYIGHQPDWADKTENRLLWRGSTTGAEFAKDVDWKNSQRARLHFMSHETTGSRKVLWADEQTAREDIFSVKQMNERWLDTSFSGEPVQCDEETCELMRKLIDFHPIMGLDQSNQYRYLVDVDGNGWSGRFHRLMSTKSAVLKASIFPEWYSDRIQPWLHYVPLKVDYTDLYDIMAFFLGRPTDGKGAHDELGHKIAEAGRLWALEYWRREDMSSYMFRLLLEWIRVLHRDEPDYEMDYDPNDL